MILYIILFIIWLFLCTYLAGRILLKILPVTRQLAAALGIFFSFSLLSLVANIFTAWLNLSDPFIIAAFVIVLILLAAIYFYYAPLTPLPAIKPASEPLLPAYVGYAVILLALVVVGFYFVFAGSTGGQLASPWQALSPLFLVVALVCALAVLYLSQSKINLAVALLAVLAFSLLIHSYLLVYQNGFGGDRFRHLGSEYRLLSGLEYQPTLLTQNLWLVDMGPLKVPQALVDSAKLSYGGEWSLEVIASKITGIDVFQLNRFLLPVLWALFLPLIIFVIALLLTPSRQFALLAATLSSGFYLWQYYGAQGLPATWGVLNFAFGVMLWLAYLRRAQGRIPLLAIVFTLLNYFNYSLAFILLAAFGVLALSVKRKGWTALWLVVIFVALVGLDFVSSRQISFYWTNFYHAWTAGNLWYFNSGLSLWPQWGIMPKIFDLAVLAIFFLFYIISLVSAWHRNDPAWRLIAWFSLVILAAYFVSWSVFAGEHTLARRLTLFAILPILLLFCQLISSMIKRRHQAELAVVVVAFLMMVSYYSGPTLDLVITSSDWQRAQTVWAQIKNQPSSCVKESLPVILALEAVSAKEFQETTNNAICNK